MTTNTESDKKVALIIYILYALAFVTGITGVAGMIMAYIKRPEIKGNWVESHITWQIRTFWYALIGFGIGFITLPILIGFVITPVVTIWMIIRIARGWLALNDERPIGVEIKIEE